MTATARDLLAMKNSAVVYTCSPDATVADACRVLRERRVGCLVVARGGVVHGLFTERDVVTSVVAAGLDPAATRVREAMTRDVEVAPLELTVDAVEAALRRRRVRHLPVVGERGLLGVVSLGDLARFYALRERAARADALGVAGPAAAGAH
jgi:CBS domain-containing protein